MGYSKYFEDNLDYVIEDRGLSLGPFFSYEEVLWDALRAQKPIRRLSKQANQVRCPLCEESFDGKKKLNSHIKSAHANHNVVLKSNGFTIPEKGIVDKVPSQLSIQNYTDTVVHVRVNDYGRNEEITFDLKPESTIDLLDKVFKETGIPGCAHLRVEYESTETSGVCGFLLNAKCISDYPQLIDAHVIHSEWYDGRIADGLLSTTEMSLIMLLAVSENDEEYMTDLLSLVFQHRIDKSVFDPGVLQAAMVYLLFKGDEALDLISAGLSHDEFICCMAVYYALHGNRRHAEELTNRIVSIKEADAYSYCVLIVSMIVGDDTCAKAFEKATCSIPLLLSIKRLIEPALRDTPIELTHDLHESIQFMSIFKHIPIVSALIDAYTAIAEGRIYSEKSAAILNRFSAACTYHYCLNTRDLVLRQKRWKNACKHFPEAALFKTGMSVFDPEAMKPSDGNRYREKLKEYIEKNSIQIPPPIVDWSMDDDFYITPISGGGIAGESCFIVTVGNRNIMLDCGGQFKNSSIFQQLDKWYGSVDGIILSHAHTDHTGAICKAHSLWPNAPIYSSYQTKAFLSVLLSDQPASTAEEEWDDFSIEKEEAAHTYQSIIPVLTGKWYKITENCSFRLYNAGHIPGSVMIELQAGNRIVLYTGDFCTFDQATSRGCNVSELPRHPDLLICESTLLDRENCQRVLPWSAQREALAKRIEEESSMGHCVVLPVSAFGKCQEIICLIGEMAAEGRISAETPLYLGGLALKASEALVGFMTTEYEEVLRRFKPFVKGVKKTDRAPVIVASGAVPTTRSVSGKAIQWCKQVYGGHAVTVINTNHTASNMDIRPDTIHCGLDNHARAEELKNLLTIQPRALSFVHWSSEKPDMRVVNDIRSSCGFSPLLFDFSKNERIQINDVLKQLVREEITRE